MNPTQLNNLVDSHGPEHIIDNLSPFILDPRKHRIEQVINHRLGSLHLAMECPQDIGNAHAAMRSAEALGISFVHIIDPKSTAKSIKPITQGAFHWIDHAVHDSLDDFLLMMRQKKFQLAGGIPNSGMCVSEVPVINKLCLLIGNESKGLSDAAISACDFLFTIPMVGMCESFNLSVSAAISLYDFSNRKRAQLPTPGDLTTTEATTMRARYYLNSVSEKLIQSLFT